MVRLSRHLIVVLSCAVLLSSCGKIELPFSRGGRAADPGGRYMIISPQKEIFLLDTATGRTWLLAYDQGGARWRMIIVEEETAGIGGNRQPVESPAITDNAAHPATSSPGNR